MAGRGHCGVTMAICVGGRWGGGGSDGRGMGEGELGVRGCGACCRASASAWMQRVHCTFALPRYIERVSRSSRFFGPRLQVEAGRRCELMLHTARSPY